MKWVGRRLYIDWGTMVIAIDKLPGMNKSELGLVRPLGEQSMPTKLVDVYDMDGSRLEYPVEGTPFKVVNCGWEIGRYITETSMWMTKEESEKGREQRQDFANTVRYGGQLGEAYLFYLGDGLSSERQQEIKEWIDRKIPEDQKYTEQFIGKIVQKDGSIWIFDGKLAMEFKLIFAET